MSSPGGIGIIDLIVIVTMVACTLGLTFAAWRLLDAVEVEIHAFFSFNDETIGLHGAVVSAENSGLNSGKGSFFAGDGCVTKEQAHG